jgi:hypothetical protein
MWACGQLQYPATVKLLLLSISQASILPKANPQDISNVLWAVGALGMQQTEGVFQQLVQQFVRVLPQANTQAVSNTLWAAAKLNVQLSDGVVQQLVQHFVKVLPQAKPQEVSNTLWAVATLDIQLPQDVVQQVVQHLEQVLPRAKPQEVSNTLWALATLEVQLSQGVVQQLVQHFVKVLPQAKPQQVSNTLWALATLDVVVADSVMRHLMQHFVQVLPHATLQAVSNTLWAAATLKVQLSEGIMQQLLQHFTKLLQWAKPQDVSNTLWACGNMQFASLQLLSALEQQTSQVESLLTAAIPQALANMAWACGQLGYRGKLLPGVLLQQAVQLQQDSNRGSCSMQDLCNMCWSAAVLDMQQLVPQVLQLAAACKDMWDTAAREAVLQLYQVHLWLLDSQLPQRGQGLLCVLSQQQLQQCKDSWEQVLVESTTSVQVSGLQRSVFAALQALPGDIWQQAPAMEQRSADGALSVDIAATTVSGVQLAIEVDGPNQYIRPERTYDGSTLFENRALAARGYVLVSISYWEWNALRAAEQKQQYLLTKLQAAAAEGSGPAHKP